ncbi:hypothetical protein [Pseudonocardia dioxanivorans]|uniref:hypothetical protein n=1 Tax=Pseudonocardia dioxanivorans TaxID=240495 RepID=UPI000CD00F38|nr:hypothetical protein [Pseudonocardia dioxanivorans]
MRWSARIHAVGSDRHGWALRVAALLDDHGPDVELPPFPSRMRATRESREETARRLFGQARLAPAATGGLPVLWNPEDQP